MGGRRATAHQHRRRRRRGAGQRILWVYQYLFVEAIRQGGLRPHAHAARSTSPTRSGRASSTGWACSITSARASPARRRSSPCVDAHALLSPASARGRPACRRSTRPTTCRVMGYEHRPGRASAPSSRTSRSRWPDLPLIVTESGIATEVGARRAEIEVRALEQIAKAQQGRRRRARLLPLEHLRQLRVGAMAFVPHFGLYTVDYTTYARTPTLGATVSARSPQGRSLTDAQQHAVRRQRPPDAGDHGRRPGPERRASIVPADPRLIRSSPTSCLPA